MLVRRDTEAMFARTAREFNISGRTMAFGAGKPAH